MILVEKLPVKADPWELFHFSIDFLAKIGNFITFHATFLVKFAQIWTKPYPHIVVGAVKCGKWISKVAKIAPTLLHTLVTYF